MSGGNKCLEQVDHHVHCENDSDVDRTELFCLYTLTIHTTKYTQQHKQEANRSVHTDVC